MTRKTQAILILLLSWTALPVCGQGLQDWPSLSWSAGKDLQDVRSVFPHPLDPLVVWVATAGGLLKSADDGQTFKPVPSASADKVGLVTALACCPADENRILLGTENQGLYLSTDAGVTWSRLGDQNDSPASASVAAVAFSNSDPSWRTILVTHGRSAPGISVSRDLGKTWEVLAADRYLGRFVQSGDTFIAAGSMVETEGRSWGIHRSGFDGRRWEECNRGLPVGQPACPYLRPDHFYFSTLDGRMLVSTDDGQTWFTAAESQSSRWVSLFFTRGRADNVEILAAYDPYRRGLVLSSSRLRTATWRSENKGLYVGSYVKSGASCAANANGTTYYIVLNNALWTARRTRTRPDGPMVVQARCLPATIWVPTDLLRTAQATLNRHIEDVAEAVASESAVGDIAQAIRTANQRKADLNITVQARVEHPKGRSALKVVTADLTVLGGRPDAELLDDGKHGDGPAGDGLWAATFPFNPTAFDRLPEHDRRWPLPGVTAITVSAIDTSGASDSWSAAVSVQRRPEPVSIHPLAIGYRFGSVVGDGPVDLHDDGANALLPRHAALCFTASKPGAWRAARIAGSGVNIIGCQTLSFYIKGDLSQDLYVQLVDRYQVGEDLVDEPHFSRPVNLISGGYLKAITPKYQQVRIPISALLPKGALFLPRHAAGIALGAGPDGKPGKYYLDQAYALP